MGGGSQAHPKTGLKGPVKLWEGSPMTIYSTAVANWDSTGYGSLLESPSVRSSFLQYHKPGACPPSVLLDSARALTSM